MENPESSKTPTPPPPLSPPPYPTAKSFIYIMFKLINLFTMHSEVVLKRSGNCVLSSFHEKKIFQSSHNKMEIVLTAFTTEIRKKKERQIKFQLVNLYVSFLKTQSFWNYLNQTAQPHWQLTFPMVSPPPCKIHPFTKVTCFIAVTMDPGMQFDVI